MNDVFGRNIKKGNFILLYPSNNGSMGLIPAIVLTSNKDNIKTVRAKKMVRSWRTDQRGSVSVLTKPHRIAITNDLPYDIQYKLREAFDVFWESR